MSFQINGTNPALPKMLCEEQKLQEVTFIFQQQRGHMVT